MKEQEQFIDYMRFTLARDLEAEGRTETAKDIERLCQLFLILEHSFNRVNSEIYHAQQEVNEYKRQSEYLLKGYGF